jgi:hypothetical protein
MLEAHIFRTYQKDLRNLAPQERLLRSQLKQHTAELLRRQAERLENAAAEETDAKPKPAAVENGFEFSTQPTQALPAPNPASNPAATDRTNLKSEATAA